MRTWNPFCYSLFGIPFLHSLDICHRKLMLYTYIHFAFTFLWKFVKRFIIQVVIKIRT